jgi:hypothetical protein
MKLYFLLFLFLFCKQAKFSGSVAVTPPPANTYHSTDTYPSTPSSSALPTDSNASSSSDPLKGVTSKVSTTTTAQAVPVTQSSATSAAVTPAPVAPTPAPAPQASSDNNWWIPVAAVAAVGTGIALLAGGGNNDKEKPPQGFILGDAEKNNCKREYLRYPNTIKNYAYGLCQGTLGSETSPQMGTCIDQCVAAAKS